MEWQRLPRPKKADIAAARRDLKKTRFLADESVEVAVDVLLRRQGFNVVHTSEAGMRGHPDENIFAYAARENRVLLTHDGMSVCAVRLHADGAHARPRAVPPQRLGLRREDRRV